MIAVRVHGLEEDRKVVHDVWHGYGSESLFSQTASDETVARAVDAVLAKYPPAATSGKAASTPAVSAEDEMPESPKVKADDMEPAGSAK